MTSKTRIATTRVAIAVPLAALVVLVGLGLLIAGCGGSSGASSGTSSSRDAAVAEPAPGQATGSGLSAASKGASGGAGAGYAADLPPASAPSAHYLVRTGDLSLLVAHGTILSAVDRISAMTTALDGYVLSSSVGSQAAGTPEPMPLATPVGAPAQGSSSGATSGYAGAQPYASIVVRVPEQLFDVAVRRFSRLGQVQSVSTSSDDVTSQYVDLQARLRHYQAVEARLVRFLQQTRTINQMLEVQDRIDRVQLTIEELSAQFKALRETTTYATLSVYVTERDATAAAIHGSNTFGGTLRNSIHLLGSGIRLAALVLTALAPFILIAAAIGALVWYMVRRARRSRREASPPSQAG